MMTDQRVNSIPQLRRAAHAAVTVDAWLGSAMRRATVDYYTSNSLPDNVATLVTDHTRTKHLLGDFIPGLLKLFREKPELIGWLDSREDIAELKTLIGMKRVGGLMRRFIKRTDVDQLIEVFGERAWTYGLDHGAGGLALVNQVDDVINHINEQGGHALGVYLESCASGLASDIEAVTKIDLFTINASTPSSTSPSDPRSIFPLNPQDEIDSVNTVLSEMA